MAGPDCSSSVRASHGVVDLTGLNIGGDTDPYRLPERCEYGRGRIKKFRESR